MAKAALTREWLRAALVDVLDGPLRQAGFDRPAKSLTYSRKLDRAKQQILFITDHAVDADGAECTCIFVSLRLLMPEVSAGALALVEGDASLLGGAPEIILNQPVEFTAPKSAFRRWLANEPKDFHAACNSILDVLEAWALPFLDDLSTPTGLLDLYEADDERVPREKRWYIYVASAYRLEGRSEAIGALLARHFDNPGLRRRYAPFVAALS